MNKVVLSSIIDIISGGTPKTSVPEYWNGDIGWLSVTDFNNDNRFVYETEKTITERGVKESNTKFLQIGDIIISARGTVGALAQIGKPMCFNQSCFGIRGKKDKVANDYLFYALRNYVKNIVKRSQGSVFDTINLASFDLMELNIHTDLHTQKSIAKILSDLDAKIELNNKINRELEAMAKTLYDYWFVQFDFPDANGRPYKSSGGKMVYNAELKREIPEGWEVKKLGDIIKKYADKSTHIESKNILNEGSYPVITQDNGDLISGFTNENNPIEDVPLIVFGDHSCTLRYIDFPFFRGADGTQIMYFEEDLTIYVYLFLQMIITQIPGYGKYERHYKYLKEFNIIIPKAKFLSEFQKIVEPIFNKISKSRLQNQHLTTLRDWLLPMLMNGQVTVKEAQEKFSMAAEPSVKYGN
jgi:type I restriction enzyme S subunit